MSRAVPCAFLCFFMIFYYVSCFCFFFFFNDTATTEIYTLSLHDALPISGEGLRGAGARGAGAVYRIASIGERRDARMRSEEHTSELQSQFHLVCRLLLEKKKKKKKKKKNNKEQNQEKYIQTNNSYLHKKN